MTSPLGDVGLVALLGVVQRGGSEVRLTVSPAAYPLSCNGRENEVCRLGGGVAGGGGAGKCLLRASTQR